MSTEDRIYWTTVAFLAVVGAAVAARSPPSRCRWWRSAHQVRAQN